jgi:NAD(P)-dependent dehydrogenase (short-subunit alcohol dehydrogenase family)
MRLRGADRRSQVDLGTDRHPVNNVGGGGGGDGPAHRAEEAAWDRILTVNLKSAWMTIKHALPIMRGQNAGVIVNISSLASLAGSNQVAYEVSKAAMNRLTTSVANANAAHGVRCNAVLPGLPILPRRGTQALRASRTASVDEPTAVAIPDTAMGVSIKPPGTQPMRRCSWPLMKPISLPACCCRWTEACPRASAEDGDTIWKSIGPLVRTDA